MNEPISAKDSNPDAQRDAIAEEQIYLDTAHERRRELLRSLDTELATPAQDAVEQAHHRGLARQRTELQRAENGLIFGRLDSVDGTAR